MNIIPTCDIKISAWVAHVMWVQTIDFLRFEIKVLGNYLWWKVILVAIRAWKQKGCFAIALGQFEFQYYILNSNFNYFIYFKVWMEAVAQRFGDHGIGTLPWSQQCSCICLHSCWPQCLNRNFLWWKLASPISTIRTKFVIT